MPPKKKESVEVKEIDFDKVMESIREPEEIKMKNIFTELTYTPGTIPDYLLGYAHNPDGYKYQDYLEWLRSEGIEYTQFYVGRELNYYGGYRKHW